MMIHVTYQDIAEGIIGSAESCPVARAVARSLHLKKQASVDEEWVTVDEEEIVTQDRIARTPKSVRLFIKRFDNHKSVKPFVFQLRMRAMGDK